MKRRGQKGFSLIEILVVVVVFTVVTGAVFGLLDMAQQRYKMESEFLDTFQSARLSIDQMARDIHSAGYPPANSFSGPPAPAPAANLVASTPFAWSPGYPGATCVIGACTTPGNFDLIIEADIDPQNNNGVEWVRYRLNGTTLERGVASKVAGGDPVAATQAAGMVAYVDNVMNNTTVAQMNMIRSFYAGMFPGNNPVPVFAYGFENAAGCPNQPAPPAAQVPAPPTCVREVNITLIVMSANRDPKTRQPRLVTLTARVRRINPSQ